MNQIKEKNNIKKANRIFIALCITIFSILTVCQLQSQTAVQAASNYSWDNPPISHFYEDYQYKTPASNSTIRIYANGGNVDVQDSLTKKDYRKCILYTDITASYNYKENDNHVVRPSTGKVIVGISTSSTSPNIVNGKIVDKEAARVAYASIRSGQITVTARQQTGKVYLWAVDTGSANVSACCPVTVVAAPTATNLYSMPDTSSSFTYGKTPQYKTGKINVGETTKVYLYPTSKQNGVTTKVSNVTYTATMDDNCFGYFAVSKSSSNPLCFEVRAYALKNGKSATGKITFTCNLTGKKTTFKAVSVNRVSNIMIDDVHGLSKRNDIGNSLGIRVSKNSKATGSFGFHTVCATNTSETTDTPRIYAMGSKDGYDKKAFEDGTVKITEKPSAAQKKISMTFQSDKKAVHVTAAKGTKPDTTAYFLLVYNHVEKGTRKGYQVIRVTAEE